MPEITSQSVPTHKEQALIMQDEYHVERTVYFDSTNIIMHVKPKERYFFDNLQTYNEDVNGNLKD